MLKRDYGFYIRVDPNGDQAQIFDFYPQNLLKLNYLLGDYDIVYTTTVKKYLAEIDRVLNGEIDEYIMGAQDALTIVIKKNNTKAIDLIQLFGFDKEDETVLSLEFRAFLQDWYEFLQMYDANGIPNLITVKKGNK